MQNTTLTRRRGHRVLQFIAALGLSATTLAAIAADSNPLWAELRASPQVSCPQDVALPRPLVAAAACGDLDRVRDRVKAGADLAATDHRAALAGRTALHHAAQRGDAAMVALLLDAGADPNARDARGNTPLHLLAMARPSAELVDVAKSLLAYGGDATLANAQGRTPAKELEQVSRRSLNPLRIDRSGLIKVLEQAEATGPVRTAEPTLPQRQAEAAAPAEAAPAASTEATAEAPAAAVVEAATESAAPMAAAEAAAPAEPAAAEAAPEAAPAVVAQAAAPAAPEPAAPPAERAPEAPTPAPVAKAEAAAPAAVAKAEAEVPAKAEPARPEPTANAEAAVRDALDSWARDWSSGDPDAYLKHYSRHFVPSDGNSLEGWKSQRRARVEKPESIHIALADIAITVDGDKAIARFVQDYQSDSYKVVNNKQVTFGLEGRSWKIVDERTVD